MELTVELPIELPMELPMEFPMELPMENPQKGLYRNPKASGKKPTYLCVDFKCYILLTHVY